MAGKPGKQPSAGKLKPEAPGSGKKSKKKFARHKIRSESPENLLVDLDDPAETQVVVNYSAIEITMPQILPFMPIVLKLVVGLEQFFIFILRS